MTWLDWLIVAMTIWFLLQGVLKGGAAAFFGALAIVASFIIAAMLLPSLGQGIAGALTTNIKPKELPAEDFARWARMTGFIVPLIIVYIVLSLIINLLPGGKRPSMLAQVVGVFTGLLKSLTAASALVGILLASPFSAAMAADVERSSIARSVAEIQRGSIQGLRAASPIKFPPVGPDHKF
ncbi:MAG TPA: CvpA family protein [bacterium]|nr:CvpA family protein [bacterium]